MLSDVTPRAELQHDVPQRHYELTTDHNNLRYALHPKLTNHTVSAQEIIQQAYYGSASDLPAEASCRLFH
jgi:hypothetical protein